MAATCWTARYDGVCPACRGDIITDTSTVQWSTDGTKVIHARELCRRTDPTRPPAVCPVHGLTLPATGICDDCA